MYKIVEYNNIKHISIDGEYANNNDYIKILKDTINKNGYYSNKFYPIIINNRIIFAWINTKNNLHLYDKMDHYYINKKGELIYSNTIFKSEFKKLIEIIKDDNEFLNNNNEFNKYMEV